MNKLLIFLSIIIFSANIFAQDYNIDHKQIHVVGKKKKYEIKLNYPVLSLIDENRGSKIKSFYGFNTSIRNRMEAERDSFIVWMNDWDINEHNKDMSSEYELNDQVYYSSNDLISIQFYGYSYFAGAAHPNNWSFSINYDLDNSREIFLKDILNPGWETTISEICIAEINKQKKDKGIEPDEWLKEGAGPKAENFDVFNITKAHLLITFPTYQVGAYVEGPSEVEIPYTAIKDLIKKDGLLAGFVK